MDIKEIAQALELKMQDPDDGRFDIGEFAEALIAELAKQNEPVVTLKPDDFGWGIWEDSLEHKPDGSILKLYTFPPTAEQIANETAEACAKACEDVIGNTPHDQRMLAAIDCAVMLRSGAWKEFKR